VAGEHPSHLKRVNVDAYDGTIYLSGFVERPIEKSDAEIAACTMEGVRKVVNDIVVGSREEVVAAAPVPPPRTPVRGTIPGATKVAPTWSGGPDHAFDKDGRVVATIYTVIRGGPVAR
jgi:hypothetical protein